MGDIDINSVMPLAIYEDALMFAIDCKQKYPESDISMMDHDGFTTIFVHLLVGEDTVPAENQRDEDEASVVQIKLEGDWRAATDDGKYGPRLFLIRSLKTERDENWVGWYCEE